MSETIHIYCDESCHLERADQRAMVLGGLACPADVRKLIGRKIKDLKREHQIQSHREIKWTQVSPSRLGFYLALVDLFFDTPELGFRAVVVPDKAALDHLAFNQTHDDFYYKMWWQLLTRLIDADRRYRVFVDIKDTRSASKLLRLHEILCNTHRDFEQEHILGVEVVRSHDVPLLQLTDVLTGALSHLHRGLTDSQAKGAVIERIRSRSGLPLVSSTPPVVRKMNVFVWRHREAV